FAFDLKQQVIDPVGGGLTFEAANLPPWLTLNASTGQLTGVPRRPYLGSFTGITVTARGVGGSAQAEAFGFVLKTVKPPVWVKKEFELPAAREDEGYSQKLSDFVMNEEEGAALNYEIITQTPPTWLEVGKTSGALFGTPTAENVGP